MAAPVAGSLPLWLRSGQRADWGDWEQSIPELYRVMNYLELYVLGASGPGRGQLQVLNQYDPCCFAGVRSRVYETVVAERVASMGAGGFAVLIDDSHAAHAISPIAVGEFLVLRGLATR